MPAAKGTDSEKLAVQRQLKIKVGAAKRCDIQRYISAYLSLDPETLTTSQRMKTGCSRNIICTKRKRMNTSAKSTGWSRRTAKSGTSKMLYVSRLATHTTTTVLRRVLRACMRARVWTQRGNECANSMRYLCSHLRWLFAIFHRVEKVIRRVSENDQGHRRSPGKGDPGAQDAHRGSSIPFHDVACLLSKTTGFRQGETRVHRRRGAPGSRKVIHRSIRVSVRYMTPRSTL